MTEGCRDERMASSVPKSAGDEDSTLDGSAIEDRVVIGMLQSY
jgi:hypothetical protein